MNANDNFRFQEIDVFAIDTANESSKSRKRRDFYFPNMENGKHSDDFHFNIQKPKKKFLTFIKKWTNVQRKMRRKKFQAQEIFRLNCEVMLAWSRHLRQIILFSTAFWQSISLNMEHCVAHRWRVCERKRNKITASVQFTEIITVISFKTINELKMNGSLVPPLVVVVPSSCVSFVVFSCFIFFFFFFLLLLRCICIAHSFTRLFWWFNVFFGIETIFINRARNTQQIFRIRKIEITEHHQESTVCFILKADRARTPQVCKAFLFFNVEKIK